MSSFKGRMGLYTNICIDRFDGINLRCTAFFLSHCHKDHMTGLDDKKFETVLRARSGVFLYCSEITRLLLLADEEYKPLEKFIKVLHVGATHFIKIPPDQVERGECNVYVTPISAGHCPGSVMFLFEGSQGTCLYTGDFRWEPNYAAKVSAFGCPEKQKVIDHLYIDTTFCVPAALHIPSRVECADATVSVVASWLERSPLHQVAFFCPARYGYEYLFKEIATRLGMKIHVSDYKFAVYEQIPDLSGLFTADPAEARIHACCPRQKKNSSHCPPCLSKKTIKNRVGENPKPSKSFQMLNIRPCAMWFTTKAGRTALEKLTHMSPQGLQRVCYSMHSSFSEIEDLVSYLQPRHVWPNVIPASDHSPEQVQSRLKGFLEKTHPFKPKVVRPETGEPQTTGLALDLVSRRPPASSSSLFRFHSQNSDSSDGCVFDSQDRTEPNRALKDMARCVSDVESSVDSHSGRPGNKEDIDEDAGQPPGQSFGYEGEEADSELHLRLSQDSNDSEDSQDSIDSSQNVHNGDNTLGNTLPDNTRHRDDTLQTITNTVPKNVHLTAESPSKTQYGLNMVKNTEHSGSTAEGTTASWIHCLADTKSGTSQLLDNASSVPQHLQGLAHKLGSNREERISVTNTLTELEDKKQKDTSNSLSEEDDNVIESSPVSSKKFTSLLKGKPCRLTPTFQNQAETATCSLPAESMLISHQGGCIGQQPNLQSSHNQSKDTLSPENKNIYENCSAGLGPSSVQRFLKKGKNSCGTTAKRLKLSPEVESKDYVKLENCIDALPAGGDTSSDCVWIDKEEKDNKRSDRTVCVIPSDSEETDEDSDKLLTQFSRDYRRSKGPWLTKRRTKFIDLTKDA
ncbi:protein artemis [Plakobranchus ocellatus]|uniref:Protein artemis n=1 Tax=Plakobranchus ocellatus TaxID=259542 RepID=A0AAV3Z0F0_9GAST|nr:protein artemis [Plakobranchus ocellatus]